jgi:hypothetical protein
MIVMLPLHWLRCYLHLCRPCYVVGRDGHTRAVCRTCGRELGIEPDPRETG